MSYDKNYIPRIELKIKIGLHFDVLEFLRIHIATHTHWNT